MTRAKDISRLITDADFAGTLTVGDLTASSLNGGQFGGRRNIVINGAMEGKLNNCWKRFQQEWTTKLMNDESFTDAIPSNQADFVALVIARDDYQTRKERDDANAIS